MFTFTVVEEKHGWAVRVGDSMKTPFRSRAIAIREAHNLAQALRGHGELTQVVIETLDAAESGPIFPGISAPLLASHWRGRRVGVQ